MSAVHLAHHFEDLRKQGHAARLGMWVFLTSELMLFAALFATYTFYRVEYPVDFDRAARHSYLAIGSINTLVLITSSFLVAMSLAAVKTARFRGASWLLLGAVALGGLFLVLKGIEYAGHASEGIAPGAHYHYAELPQRGCAIFFTLYYAMTGLHALHVFAGMVILAILAGRVGAGAYGPGRDEHVPLELGTLYWHLVDAIWIFLWPMFYLVR